MTQERTFLNPRDYNCYAESVRDAAFPEQRGRLRNERLGQDRVDGGQRLPEDPTGSTTAQGIPGPPSVIILATG